MVFSSISFLYYFLPIVLFMFFIAPKKYRNVVLLVSSISFYFYGEGKLTIILIGSCLMNYLLGILIDKCEDNKYRKMVLSIGLILNTGMLMYFKYSNFFIDNINNILNMNLKYMQIIMPLGISFFTFQTISYLIDVYRKDVKAEKNIINLATYITLFPQLIAGPIVRYVTIKEELINKEISFKNASYGIKRFVIGLSKKVLLANNIGLLIELMQKSNSETLLSYWIIAISFALQIYFDFSGYSDMAIGLGRIFGFKFLENFNYPYISKTVTEFWRRWHISLSSFFKDYIYIPLGGNRCNILKWIRNIAIVWFLTGFWHGAAWNFVVWGLFFAIILLLEKFIYLKWMEKKKIFSHIYVLLIVIISFSIFNSNSLVDAYNNVTNLFNMYNLKYSIEDIYYLKSFAITLVLAIIAATPLLKTIYTKLKEKNSKILLLEIPIFLTLFLLNTAYLIDSTFNPFLYFRF